MITLYYAEADCLTTHDLVEEASCWGQYKFLGKSFLCRETCGLLDEVLVVRLQTDLWFAG